jgi:hypothetical protein
MKYSFTHFKILLPMLFFIVEGCGQLQEMMQKSQDIQRILASECDCEEVRMVNYSIENFTNSAHCEMVGCKFESLDKESERISALLKKEIKGFCEIDDFTIDFINKGKHQLVQLQKCKAK